MRLPSILAHVLATSTFIACGGQTAGVPDSNGTSGASGSGSSGASGTTGSSSSGSSGSSGSTGVIPPTPPPTDAGVPDAESCEPVLVRSGRDCSDVYQQKCGIPKGVDPSDGMTQAECDQVCGKRGGPTGTYWGCSEYLLDDLPGPSFSCYTCVEGRRPEGYVQGSVEPTISGWLAHAADLERVSIDAFQILRSELAHHGAPPELLAWAERAEADEVRHADALGGLARREGATLVSTPVKHGPARGLVEIALENAIEGCIRETYGALVAAHQAEHAERLDVRRAMKRIARDETSHAELAWRVHAWLMTKLDASEHARVVDAMRHEIRALEAGARAPVGRELEVALGLPPSRTAVRLVSGLDALLWVPALAA